MSKLTFRADDDLVERVEALDASKSEVMRDALRQYLDGSGASPGGDTLDALVADRVDALIAERLDGHGSGRDVNVNITLERPARVDVDGSESAVDVRRDADVQRAEAETEPCTQCGEPIASDHVYCPNCGEKRSRRAFCECGDELRTDWSFCPSCGRRTPAADVLDGS